MDTNNFTIKTVLKLTNYKTDDWGNKLPALRDELSQFLRATLTTLSSAGTDSYYLH